ncbi:MAG: hypothetical protein RSG92_13410, partial [Pseudomonas sp.]
LGPEASVGFAMDTFLVHQPRNPFVADSMRYLTQCLDQPWPPIGASTGRMDPVQINSNLFVWIWANRAV